MRIAFYAPMKPPSDPVPSGDRTLARLLIAALAAGGHTVELASTFRSFDRNGDAIRQQRIASLGPQLADRLLRRWRQRPARRRPRLWFTYHLYHKAPDYLGPPVCERLGLPYVVAEASSAGKRAQGCWAEGHAAAAAAMCRADLLLGLNPADDEGVRALLPEPHRLQPFPPFIDAQPYARAAMDRIRHRSELVARLGIDPTEPLLLTVAMMRWGDKLASFRLLAEALAPAADRPWRLLICGDGPARSAVEAAFAPLAGRIIWLGALGDTELPALYAAVDLYVWPAVGEAWGMALLEAQAAGLPVVAGACGGVAAIVTDGRSGLLVPVGDAGAFAAAVSTLLADADRRVCMGWAARARIAGRHDLPAASRRLQAALRPVVAAAAARRKA